jgi:diguanylate cyclase (GGDEF)-like protein
MALDSKTLLVAMLLIVFLTACSNLLIWTQDRKQTALFWIGAASALFCAGMIGRVLLPFVPAIVFGNAATLICYGGLWTACRSLRQRPVRPVWSILPALAWCGLCCIPAFRANLDWRIGMIGVLISAPIALMAREIWRVRPGPGLLRYWMLTLLGLQLAFTLAQSIPALLRPDVASAPYLSMPGIVETMFDSIAFALLLSFGLFALSKELSDARHREALRHDVVTGVGNRRHFEECLQRHFRRARKLGQPLALIMIDADEFKKYNDLYGHPAGDRCLQAMAKIILGACRPGDVVARYGGEEFAVLLPETNCRGAIFVAQRMLAEVRALRLEHAHRPQGIATISLGVAAMVPHSEAMTHEALVEAADRMLYQAKQEGRDRICWAVDQYELPAAEPEAGGSGGNELAAAGPMDRTLTVRGNTLQ